MTIERFDQVPGMSQPALRALATAGIETFAQLAERTAREVGSFHGMGPKGIRVLREALQAQGSDFADAHPPTG